MPNANGIHNGTTFDHFRPKSPNSDSKKKYPKPEDPLALDHLEPERFYFSVETVGSLQPEEVVRSAIRILVLKSITILLQLGVFPAASIGDGHA